MLGERTLRGHRGEVPVDLMSTLGVLPTYGTMVVIERRCGAVKTGSPMFSIAGYTPTPSGQLARKKIVKARLTKVSTDRAVSVFRFLGRRTIASPYRDDQYV